MNTLPDYKEFQATRDYMQDLAKIMGEAQQTYSKAQEHYWHVGLLIQDTKIVSQQLQGDLENKKFMLDFAIHLFHTPWGTINVRGKSPEEVFTELDYLSEIALTKPEFTSRDTTSYDIEQAQSIMHLFNQMNETLKIIKSKTTTFTTSPILLFPHHFDLSLVTFIENDDEHQVAFGVSTGDEAIAEPYLYILTGPYKETLKKLKKPVFLKVETAAFTGFSASITSIQDNSDARAQIAEFHASILKAINSV